MRAYRVFPYLPTARAGQPGHASFVPPSKGANRLDNPEHYTVRYFAESPAGAIAETLGQYDTWLPSILLGRPGSGARRALATYEVKDRTRILDLDDGAVLAERTIRPTQVVQRNLAVTQTWALRIFEERMSPRGPRRWDGVRWWSWYRPEWPVLGLWSGDVELLDVHVLDLRHAAVREAADALGRPLR